ncbi:peptidase aspartic active site, partial [Trifolium medium]|nr:peptidase aspartic active site [Trifolium medium]
MSRAKLLQVTRVVEREIKGMAVWVITDITNRVINMGRMGLVREMGLIGLWSKEVRRVGPQELVREVVLGQKCGGPFHPMHQCPDKQLRVLVMDEEENDEGEGKLLAVEVNEEEEGTDGEMSVMNLHHLGQLGQKGMCKPQSIQFKGTIHEVPVAIL